MTQAAVQGVSIEVDGAKSKLEILEERLRAIEGGGSSEFAEVAKLYPVDMVIFPKFKV